MGEGEERCERWAHVAGHVHGEGLFSFYDALGNIDVERWIDTAAVPDFGDVFFASFYYAPV